jgi:hypothetical protein
VQLFLSTPMSWSGLVARRAIATFVGAELIVAFSVLVIVIGGISQNGIINFGGIIRVVVMLTLFILAFIALSSLLVGLLHGKNTTQIVSLYVGAAWLIGFMAPYLKWPEWLVRLSIFDAFGHPYVDWPTRTSFLLIIVMIIPGYIGTFLITERSAKVI